MKRTTFTRLLRYATPAVLAALLLVAASCQSDHSSRESTTLPATIETVPATDPITDTPTESETEEPETEPSVSSFIYPSAALPDYTKYTSSARIEQVLQAQKTYAFSLNSTRCYKNGVLMDDQKAVLARHEDGTLTIDGQALSACTGIQNAKGGTPAEAAASIGMKASVYDNKLVLFYEGDLPLHTYEDLYTYEAMYLHLQGAAETELINAFIDLPDRISNGTSNTVFYTAPDLNLGIQTSVYHAQMGQSNGMLTGPALVAGEGKHASNFTTVRIFNDQQMCVTQFLAFDPSVKGGVQVSAAAVGDETLIATAPFAAHDGAKGDIRIFDTFGLLRMTVDVKGVIPGPHTILTGRFAPDVEDEVLLVASQTTNAEGHLPYALISLSDGHVISKHTLDCSFALGTGKASVPVNLTSRVGADSASLILHFPSVQAVYEGAPATAEFANAGITLPADATGVYASGLPGERYTVSLPAREGTENQSFMLVYGEASKGRELDIGFRENRFFSARYTDGYNDDQYVCQGNFQHIRTDLSNSVLSRLNQCNTNEKIDALFDTATYGDYTFSAIDQYAGALANEYMFLEPCFTHRWNKIPQTAKLAAYVDAQTGMQKYVATGKSGEYIDYEEIGSSFYNGTYADGILDLAKFRLYPLRSFLQGTASAFRGENGHPEHLVGMSPVHEHEINVPDSVGDYNYAMVEGFRGYMLNRYGSVENINRLFGTSFANRAAIDPPRAAGRGDWDAYAGEYFTEWAMYNRYIVSKRIMEAYREALLAGYPPESISAHQIPEGEAVSGFLGQADTRLTPIDVVLTCGTAYGGTRYGFIMRTPNFMANANAMGHWNVTLGEYGSLQEQPKKAYLQLEYLWEHGLRMVHHITFTDAQAAAEEEAIHMLMEKNAPRPGYTGGTAGTVTVSQGDTFYNIAEIGAGDDSSSAGLLKSIDAEGKWEGTVYLVPFHTQMQAQNLPMTLVEKNENRYTTGALPTVKNADQVELTFVAAYRGEGQAWATVEVYHDGCLQNKATTTYELTDTLTPYRFVLSNQLYETGMELVVTFHTTDDRNGRASTELTVENLTATLQTEVAAFTYYNGRDAETISKPHVGGVTFDILDRDRKH